jgi:ABC-type branched-subunit amino acid transport system substrate-binding protein
MMPISTAHKVLSMGLTSSTQTVNPQSHPYEFSVASNNTDSAATLVASTKKSQPAAKSVGIMISNDTNGATLLQEEKSAFQAAGYKVYVEQYSDTALDLTPQMQALAADKPDVIIASAFGPAAGYILQARAKLGLTVPVIGDTDFAANPLPSMVPAADLKGVYISTQSQNLYRPPAKQSQALRSFFTHVAKEGYSKITLPYVLASFAYDIVILAKVAATQANSTDSVAMTHALENLKQPAQPQWVTWPNYQFSATKHSPIYDVQALAAFGSAYLTDGMVVPVAQPS